MRTRQDPKRDILVRFEEDSCPVQTYIMEDCEWKANEKLLSYENFDEYVELIKEMDEKDYFIEIL